MNKELNCKICGKPTEASFNINFCPIPVCESCSSTIFIQQAAYYHKNSLKLEKYLKQEVKHE